MLFKIEKESPLGQELKAIRERALHANNKLLDHARELSDDPDAAICYMHGHLCGKLGGITFKDPPGRDWIVSATDEEGRKYYAPNARSGARMNALRTKFSSADDPVHLEDFCKMLGLEWGHTAYANGSYKRYNRPALREVTDHYLIDVQEPWAESVKEFPTDMAKIPMSEYYKLIEDHEFLAI